MNQIIFHINKFVRHPNKVTRNIIANFIGKFWNAFLSVLTTPFFVKGLGAESFGLVGFLASLEVIFTLLDLGLSATINKEIASSLVKPNEKGKIPNLIRTFEIIYWPIGILIGLFLLVFGNRFVTSWLNFKELTPEIIQYAVLIIGISIVAKWPISLYNGALRGFQRHDIQNLIQIIISTIRVFISYVAIKYFSATVVEFLTIQLISNIIHILLLITSVWMITRKYTFIKPRYDSLILKKIWRFALSFNLVGLIGMIVSQADKLAISKNLLISELTYYSLATTIAGLSQFFSYAVATAYFPRFAENYSLNNFHKLSKDYSLSLIIISTLTGIGVLFILLFSKEIMFIWTKDNFIVEKTFQPLLILSFSFFLNGIFNSTYTLLISSGHTKTPLIANAINLLVFTPSMFLVSKQFGLIGVSSISMLQNLFFGFFYYLLIPVELRKIVINKKIIIGLLFYVLIPLVSYIISNMTPDSFGFLLKFVLFGVGTMVITLNSLKLLEPLFLREKMRIG